MCFLFLGRLRCVPLSREEAGATCLDGRAQGLAQHEKMGVLLAGKVGLGFFLESFGAPRECNPQGWMVLQNQL